MAFPGGRREAGDASLLHALRREVAEEVGIDLERAAALLGPLDELEPVALRDQKLIIAPFVFLAPEPVEPVADPVEVQAAVWIPLARLLDPEAAATTEWRGRPHPAIRAEGRIIWGLTYRILEGLLTMTRRAGIV